jgi:hypothetical protein
LVTILLIEVSLQVSFEVSAFILDGFPDVAIKFFDEPVPDTELFIVDAFETHRQFTSLHGLVLIEDDLVVFLPQQFLDKLVRLWRHVI